MNCFRKGISECKGSADFNFLVTLNTKKSAKEDDNENLLPTYLVVLEDDNLNFIAFLTNIFSKTTLQAETLTCPKMVHLRSKILLL